MPHLAPSLKYVSALAALTLSGVVLQPRLAESNTRSTTSAIGAKSPQRVDRLRPAEAHRFGPMIEDFGSGFWEPQRVQCLSEHDREVIRGQIARSRDELSASGQLQIRFPETVRYDWPLRAANSAAANASGVHIITNFVDLDPAFPNSLLDYQCGTRTYDTSSGYNHKGIDIATWPFGWKWMDDDAVQVVAIADGTILFRADGNFDESCSSGGGSWNAIYIQHHDGSLALYGHMKRGSVTRKDPGQIVRAGEYLGVVGSSGNSTGPHLHLELYDSDGNLVDPFAGPCNSTAASSLWNSQRPYYDSAINRLMIGTASVSFPPCPGRTVTNEATSVSKGATTYFTAFFRDQLAGQVSSYRVKRPNGTIFASWTHSSTTPHYTASYWWWSTSIGFGAPSGTWEFEVNFQGETYTRAFSVL